MAPLSERAPTARNGTDGEVLARQMIAIVVTLAQELHPGRRVAQPPGLDARLDRDLGIDSLGRAELGLRLERAFAAHVDDEALLEADTLAELLLALQQSRSVEGRAAAAVPVQTPPPLPRSDAVPDHASTLVEVLDWHARQHPDRLHLTWLASAAEVREQLSYAELRQRARRLASGLLERGIARGDRLAIMLPTSTDFFVAFFGALYAGAVPVPIYPPYRRAQLEEHLRRQSVILRNAEASLLITTPEAAPLARLLQLQVESLRHIDSAGGLTAESEVALLGRHEAGDTALIQYTSGSTGDPKGVVLRHANLLANIRAMGSALNAGPSDVFVSWLPLYHDMGLIGAWLGSLYYACPLYVMAPFSFLARPSNWLQAIHRYRATLSAAPNFAFELCLSRIDDAELAGLDLSSLRTVANGAEPVSPATIRRFTRRFGPCGFSESAMAPVYGLAENAVGLAFPPQGRGPKIDRINRRGLSRDGIARTVGPEEADAIEFVGCGYPLPGHAIRIVDASGREVPDRHEARIEFRGPSSTAGYYRNPEKTADLFDGDWLDTGDRGYLASGELFVTGRTKDMIIRAGRNIYPAEIEALVGDLPGIRKGCVAAFATADAATGADRLIVLAESRKTDPEQVAGLRRSIDRAVIALLGVAADDTVVAPPGTVPKTSSGKVRRSAARALYEAGELGRQASPLWWQLLRLALTGTPTLLHRGWRTLAAWGYAAWWWTVVATGLAVIWCLTTVPRSLSGRWLVMRHGCRAILALTGMSPRIEGRCNVMTGHAIVVSNHASYLDGLLLAAVLPGEPAFVAKRELAGQFFAGALLRRLGSPFVERLDPRRSVEDAAAATALARSGRLLVYFAEGTLTRAPGLMPFRHGAFVAAAEAGLPVIPVVLGGTRSALRGEQWFPRHASLSVRFAPAALPQGNDFTAATKLRDRVRAAMLQRTDEPDLAAIEPGAPDPLRAAEC